MFAYLSRFTVPKQTELTKLEESSSEILHVLSCDKELLATLTEDLKEIKR